MTISCMDWELDHEEGWVPKNWCFQTVVLEKNLENPLDCKQMKPVHPKGNQPWILIGRNDAEAKAPILWPPDMKSQLFGKNPDPGKDWGQEEKQVTEDEMVGWHHWPNGHEFEQTLGDSEGQGSLTCYSPWGHKEWDMIYKLENNNNFLTKSLNKAEMMPRRKWFVSTLTHIYHRFSRVLWSICFLKTRIENFLFKIRKTSASPCPLKPMKFKKVRNLKRNAAKYSFSAMKAVKQNRSLKDMRHRK